MSKSGCVSRQRPRSMPTTFRPASASSLARMVPVRPTPTVTTSTGLSLVATSVLPFHRTGHHTPAARPAPRGRRSRDVQGHLVRISAFFTRRAGRGDGEEVPVRTGEAGDRVGGGGRGQALAQGLQVGPRGGAVVHAVPG